MQPLQSTSLPPESAATKQSSGARRATRSKGLAASFSTLQRGTLHTRKRQGQSARGFMPIATAQRTHGTSARTHNGTAPQTTRALPPTRQTTLSLPSLPAVSTPALRAQSRPTPACAHRREDTRAFRSAPVPTSRLRTRPTRPTMSTIRFGLAPSGVPRHIPERTMPPTMTSYKSQSLVGMGCICRTTSAKPSTATVLHQSFTQATSSVLRALALQVSLCPIRLPPLVWRRGLLGYTQK